GAGGCGGVAACACGRFGGTGAPAAGFSPGGWAVAVPVCSFGSFGGGGSAFMMLTAGMEADEGKSYFGSSGRPTDGGSAALATGADVTEEVSGSLSPTAPGFPHADAYRVT